MNMREKVMAAMEDGGWWTVPMLCKFLGTHQKSRIYAILDSEIKWGTVERGELVKTENNGLTRLWRRVNEREERISGRDPQEDLQAPQEGG